MNKELRNKYWELFVKIIEIILSICFVIMYSWILYKAFVYDIQPTNSQVIILLALLIMYFRKS